VTGELSTADVLVLLLRLGLIDEPTARDARVKEPAQRARVLKEAIGGLEGRGTTYRVSAPEVLASLRLPRADGQGIVTEDLIMQAIAHDTGLPWKRLDPLELDLGLVTRAFSRPYARRHVCLAIGEVTEPGATGGALVVALAEPRDRELLENLHRVTGREIRPVVASKSDIQRIISELYGFQTTIQAAEREFARGEDVANLEQLFRIKSDAELDATDQSIVAAVDFLLRNACEQRASDIHLEPKRGEGLVRYRIDGVLHTVHKLPRTIMPAVTSRAKMMARMDIAERRKPQDGRIKIVRDEREIEIRASTMPTVFGEKVVLRIFDPDLLLQDLGALGFFPEQQQTWQSLISRPHGVILLTGPTGSGKTTTLYSTLRALASPDVNLVTIEDPIEMVTEAFNQVQVNPRLDVTFASALRTVLRQDPDIIMVGEIRDAETARHAIQAALTGHLVFSTLHTNDSASAFSRLVDLGIEPFLLSSTIIGVAAQRLVRQICPHCAVTVDLSDEQLRILGITLPPTDPPQRLPVREGQGCPECRGTGFMGRSGVFELMPVTPAIRERVHAGADSHQLMAVARSEGMLTLHEAALRKLALGTTTFDEVYRVTAGATG
jgi:general secretion pathway protein E